VKLWLDDIRDPVRFGCLGWHWAKTADEAIAILATDTVEEASLDHDLSVNATMGLPCQEKTGYDVVCWMEATGHWPKKKPAVHSQNPSGAARMRQAIDRHYARQNGGT
jgi:hypothetical protein